MEHMEKIEIIARLKSKIEMYENVNKDKEEGVVLGLYYALTLIEHGPEYAEEKINMPETCKCYEGRDCGC